MGLKDLVGRSEAIESLAMGKLEQWLDDYKKATNQLEKFGFTVGKLTVGMGVLPEIHTSISGSIENLREDALKQMAAEHQGESQLVALLNALITARKLWERVELKLTGLTLNVTLGVPPKIDVEFH